MNINRTIEVDDKTVRFEGVLEGQELDYVIEVGLNTLMRAGMLPMVRVGDKDHHEFPDEDWEQ